MPSKEAQIAWHFSFGLELDGDGLVTVDQANEFMEAIITLAEKRGFLVGGGYSTFKEAEVAPFSSETVSNNEA
jgi:hypothetical protein